MEKNNESSSSLPMGETAQELGFSYVPKCDEVQPLDRPITDSKIECIPIINLDDMNDPTRRLALIEEIANACRRYGFFQVINHGIPQPILDGAHSAASGFFNLPTKDKAKFMCNDVHKPVRYGTSVKDGVDKIQFWRVFLKHYAHPLEDWIGQWPDSPQDYRSKMGSYVEASQKLAHTMMGLITESLGLGPTYLSPKLDSGMQVMTVNCYPPCPQPELALGLPPHSDYGCLTVVLQDSPGLQFLDEGGAWRMVPAIGGALQVHVGDQLEVLSNGRYKSVVHRVALNSDKTRISVAGLHTLGMDVAAEAAPEMVDGEKNPARYKRSSFRDFLDFISKNAIGNGRSFLNTIKIRDD